jgi:hypothetical protein
LRRDKGNKERKLITALGRIVFCRHYYQCLPCRLGDYAADAWMGVTGALTVIARQFVCLVGVTGGFASAAKRLGRLCGWSMSPQTVRRTCEAEGQRLEKWREQRDERSASPPSLPETENAAPEMSEEIVAAPSADPDGLFPGSTPRSAAVVVAPSAVAEQFAATPVAAASPCVSTLSDPTPSEATAACVPCAQMQSSSSPGLPLPFMNFRKASGKIEFQVDGAAVNTTAGWQEIRPALWIKRPVGPSAQPAEWTTRHLPRPTARVVLISMSPADEFAPRWREWSAAMGITNTAELTILADGAEWIWRHAAMQFPGAAGVLDVYHALEHVKGAAKAIYGENMGAFLAWSSAGERALLANGWKGICDWISRVREDQQQSKLAVAATDELIGYFAKHVGHLNYRDRLVAGESIGSGAVEGTNKQLIGKRLKQTGARWLPKNAVAIATLCSADYVDDWEDYWTAARSCPNQPNQPTIAV